MGTLNIDINQFAGRLFVIKEIRRLRTAKRQKFLAPRIPEEGVPPH